MIPDFPEEHIECGDYILLKRLWTTSTLDMMVLATKHKLHLPYQSMEIFLVNCNFELCVTKRQSLEEAIDAFQAIRFALYIEGLSPFLTPFITNYSVNDYSGINSRENEYFRKRLPPELQNGFTSESGAVEAWPFEMSLSFILNNKTNNLSSHQFKIATDRANEWRKITKKSRGLMVLEEVTATAPKLGSLSQSLLHMWSGLESLFPNISSELSFKIALYLSQLITKQSNRMAIYERVKASYGLRSAITHGSRKDISIDEWNNTWSLLTEAAKAVIERGKMPTEKELLEELLI